MASRLHYRSLTRCPSCSVRLLNSFASACASPVRIKLQTARQSNRITIRRITSSAVRLDGKISSQRSPIENEARREVQVAHEASKGILREILNCTTWFKERGGVGGDLHYTTNRIDSKGRVWGNLNYISTLTSVTDAPSHTIITAQPIAIQKTESDGLRSQPDAVGTVWKNLNYIDGIARVSPVQESNASVESEGRTKATPQDVDGSALPGAPEAIEGTEGISQVAEMSPIEASEDIKIETNNVPWYLQDVYATKKSTLIPERPPLPELPPDSPELLEQVIKHLDSELGMTDLRILDLRPLLQAPALGKDIIMVFGTARSEDHLHSASNKVCRWLRSTYKIHPYADGVPGRNELKLINRRLRRRGEVPASQLGEETEAARTEWVCVNVGVDGLILQLFTQARRDELKLEALWERKLDTNQKNIEKMAAAAAEGKMLAVNDLYDGTEDFGEVEEVDASPIVVSDNEIASFIEPEEAGEELDTSLSEEDVDFTPGAQKTGPISPSQFGAEETIVFVPFQTGRPTSFPNSQTRSFHTSRKLAIEVLNTKTEPQVYIPTLNLRKLPSTYGDFLQVLPSQLATAIEKGAYTTISCNFSTYFANSNKCPPRTIQQAALLFAHVKHLQNLPLETANTAIGKNAFDTTSTPFLRSFFGEMPTVPQPIHYQAWLALLIQGNMINYKLYPASSFLGLAIQMKAAGADVPIPFYAAALQAIATTEEYRQLAYITTMRIWGTTRRMKEMVKILEDMSRNSAHNINTPEVYHYLTRGLIHNDILAYRQLAMKVCDVPGAARALIGTLASPPLPEHSIDRRIFWLEEQMEKSAVAQITNPDYFAAQLTAFAMAGYWIAFWNRWNDIQYGGLARGQEAYKLVLGLLALGGNQNEALIGLRKLRNDLRKEMRKVHWGEGLARGFLAVMEVAGGGQEVGSDIAELKRKCWALVGHGKRL